jgi:hypothetical protein
MVRGQQISIPGRKKLVEPFTCAAQNVGGISNVLKLCLQAAGFDALAISHARSQLILVFGVDPGTVQRISRPFEGDGATVAAPGPAVRETMQAKRSRRSWNDSNCLRGA